MDVDDWAIRKRHAYGAILVDLHAHCLVDLLPDRSAATLAAWLVAAKPFRSSRAIVPASTPRGIRSAVPRAAQVADRWHLPLNARQIAERWLTSAHDRLRHLPMLSDSISSASGSAHRESAFPRTHAQAAASAAFHERRRAPYEEVRHRHTAGESLSAISRTMGLALGTVRKFARADLFPSRALHPAQPSILDPHLARLAQLHATGCKNALRLWRDFRERGHPGTPRRVHRWSQYRRRVPAATQPTARPIEATKQIGQRCRRTSPLPSAFQLAWLATQVPTALAAHETAVLARIEQDADAACLVALARRFAALVRDRASAPHTVTAAR